jgi:hypothetical protein
MDISNIKEHMPVYADGPGDLLSGGSEVHIGNVDKIEGGRYVKLTKHSSPDGEHHWFPLEWIRSVDERAVYLNKKADEAMAEMTAQEPAGS